MLAKKYRLPIQTAIGKKGKEERFPLFLIKAFKNDYSYSRFGVVLKKGSVKKAADRNRIRRAIFRAIQTRQKDLNVPHADFLIIAGSDFARLSAAEIQMEINNAFSDIIKK